MTIDDGGVIDEDHQRLFNIFSRCQQLEENDDNFTTKIHALIKELTQYTVEHFAREELAMKVVDYPYSKNHCNIHKLMVKELNFIVKTESLQEIRLWIVTYLSDWLIDHIMVMDKVLEPYIKANTGEVQRAMIELRAKEAT
ncbi:MAG: hemerythrin family protein [Psychromonas sp.]